MAVSRGSGFGLPLIPCSVTGDAPAVIDPEGVLSHRQLAVAVAEGAERIEVSRWGRRLVHVPLTRSRAAVIAYLSVLSAGHVALVTAPTASSEISTRYQPDGRVSAAGEVILADAPRHLLHPDLAVLLSTSGSTGSPKLVRLSATNIASNADAIITALGIQAGDRAVTSLPPHYCFGLSVLHTHLRAGAGVVLHRGAVTDPDFTPLLVRERVTTLAVTPHLLEALSLQGVLDADLPDLRLIAQAGGALAPQRISEIAALGRRRGWGLAVMYGQTEATARMAVLPPGLAERHPDSVGWPVADSTIRVDGPESARARSGTVGELVFSGPGVMMGYAEHPDDLALPRMITELRTGDLGTVDADGLVRITGRRSGFVKVMGIRVDLARVERSLAGRGVQACVTGDDDGLRVCFVAGGAEPDPDDVRRSVSDLAGIGTLSVRVRPVTELAMLPSGKVDRRACAAVFDDPQPVGGSTEAEPGDALTLITGAVGPLLGGTDLDTDRSFAELGGDSFSHVQAAIRLARLLPGGSRGLPADWHHRPLRELAGRVRTGRAAQPGDSWWSRIETSAWLRAAAVIMICGSHAGLFPLAGGAHILLAVAGFHYARYVGSVPAVKSRWRRTARAALGIGIPAVLVAAGMKLLAGAGDWPRVVMLHWLLVPGQGNIFWFVECLLVLTVALTALLSVPRLHLALMLDPWRVAMAIFIVALVPRYVVLAVADGPVRGLPWTVAWLFAAGMAMSFATTRRRQLTTAAVAAVATVGFFPHAERNLVIMVGLILLGTISSVPLPHLLARPVEVLAAASLYVYLIQFQMFTYSDGALVDFSLALLAGLTFWALAHPLVRRCQSLVKLLGPGPAEGPPDGSPLIPDRCRRRRYDQPVGL